MLEVDAAAVAAEASNALVARVVARVTADAVADKVRCQRNTRGQRRKNKRRKERRAAAKATKAPTANVSASLGGVGGAVIVPPAAANAALDARAGGIFGGTGLATDEVRASHKLKEAASAALLAASKKEEPSRLTGCLAASPAKTAAFRLQQDNGERMMRANAADVLISLEAALGADAPVVRAWRLQVVQGPAAVAAAKGALALLRAAEGLRGGMPPTAERGRAPPERSLGPNTKRARQNQAVAPSSPSSGGDAAVSPAVPDGGGGDGGGGGGADGPQASAASGADRPQSAAAASSSPAVSARPIIIETPVAELADYPSVKLWAKQSEAAFLNQQNHYTLFARNNDLTAIDFGFRATRGEPPFFNRRCPAPALPLRSILRLLPDYDPHALRPQVSIATPTATPTATASPTPSAASRSTSSGSLTLTRTRSVRPSSVRPSRRPTCSATPTRRSSTWCPGPLQATTARSSRST